MTKRTNYASITWAGYVLALFVLSNGGVMAQNVTSPMDQTDTFGAIYLDPSVSIEKRVDDLVSRMTSKEKTGQLLSVAPAIPRLRVPAYNYWSEALHGIGNDGQAAVFPQAIGFASTWNTALVYKMADAISTEARARYQEALRQDRHVQSEGLTFWSPNSICFATRVGGAARKPTGKIPISRAGWVSRL